MVQFIENGPVVTTRKFCFTCEHFDDSGGKRLPWGEYEAKCTYPMPKPLGMAGLSKNIMFTIATAGVDCPMHRDIGFDPCPYPAVEKDN